MFWAGPHLGTHQHLDRGEFIHANATDACVVVDDSDPSDKNQTTFDMRPGQAALLTSERFFRVLGMSPFLGRDFQRRR